MKVLVILAVVLWAGQDAEGLLCGEVQCPPAAGTCSIKNVLATKPRRKVVTISCFDSNQRMVLRKSYTAAVTDEELPPVPLVSCGGHSCRQGAYNCTTLSTPSLHTTPPTETTHLVCRDEDGLIIEERDIVRELSAEEAAGATPPTCEGYTCPPGSRSCTYDTTIHLAPYNKSTSVTCLDIKKKVVADKVFFNLVPPS